MKLVHNCNFKVTNLLKINFRYLSTQKTEHTSFKKQVYLSQSTDIYRNLALEDWLYQHEDFTSQQILLLWCNTPCVVIGRHQNPWLEANVDQLHSIRAEGVNLARRNSGGGTVYHDEGNLNLTFFSTKQHYNRKHNLQVITRAVFREYGLKIDISEREDLVIRNRKVSGTAAKLARKNAYHHCTLLVNANTDHIKAALHKNEAQIETFATRSTRSPILNLKDENPKIDIKRLKKIIGLEFLQSPIYQEKDKKKDFVYRSTGFHVINPTDEWFPGLSKIQENLKSWDWIYGMCPKFTDVRTINNKTSSNVKVKIMVEKGLVSGIKIESGNSEWQIQEDDSVLAEIKNQHYSESLVTYIVASVSSFLTGKGVIQNV